MGRIDLFTRFEPEARRIAGRYARGHDDFDDLYGAACLGLATALARAAMRDHSGNLASYCRTCIRFAVIDAFRIGSVNGNQAAAKGVAFKFTTFTRMAGGAVDFDYAATIADTVDEESDHFADLIEPLEGIDRSVVRLKFLADATNAQIAEVLGETEAGVEWILNRALATLRKEHAPPPFSGGGGV